MTLAGWLARTVGLRIGAAVLAMVAVLQAVDLFETLPRILDDGRGAGGVLAYLLLRAPRTLQQAAPVGVLAGALFGFARLSRDGAVTTLRASGVSAYRLALLAAPAAAGVAVLLVLLAAWGAPRSDQALAAWWRAAEPVAATAPAPRRTFRLGRDIVSASRAGDAGRRLADVEIYRRAGDGRLLSRISAASATLDGRAWRLHDVRMETYGGATATQGRAADLAWTDRLQAADLRALFDKDAVVTPAAASRALRGGPEPLPRAIYQTTLARVWAGPAGVLVLLLLAAPVALGRARDGSVTRLMVGSLAAGLLFLVSDGVSSALGSGGVLSPVLAAWAAPVVFGAGAATLLLHLEG